MRNYTIPLRSMGIIAAFSGYDTILRNGSPFRLPPAGNRLLMRNYTIPLRSMV